MVVTRYIPYIVTCIAGAAFLRYPIKPSGSRVSSIWRVRVFNYGMIDK